MAKNKQRKESYYAAGREHGKSLNAYFRVTNYKGRRWLNSGEYLRGLVDELKIQLKSKDPYRISALLWYVSELPQPAKSHVLAKVGIKLDKWGYPSFEHAGIKLTGTKKVEWYKPTLMGRVKNFFANLF